MIGTDAVGVTDSATLIYWAISIGFLSLPFIGVGLRVAVKAAHKNGERLDRIEVVLVGKDPTIEEPNPSPGMMQRLVGVEVEVNRNGGSSLADAVYRTEAQGIATQAALDEHLVEAKAMAHDMDQRVIAATNAANSASDAAHSVTEMVTSGAHVHTHD